LIHFKVLLVCLAVLILAGACSSEDIEAKIGFDLGILNEEGLYGQPDGLRALHYEFCIPPGKYARNEVASLDPSLHCTRGQGRVGCRLDQMICQGNTNQPDHKNILRSLAKLRYVERIEQSFFE
jgi:hypothetical protein